MPVRKELKCPWRCDWFDYLKRMGYNYVQLQPVFDHHKTYDKDGKLLYNWGYDPENYNVPDRQFAADQKNPCGTDFRA